MPDGKASVASQHNSKTVYTIANGTCECPDFSKAFEGWCKHRPAHAIHKKAKALTVETLQALDGPQAPRPAPRHTDLHTLPEAPASCNAYITLAGYRTQITLRDTDELRLLARMSELLRQFPLPEANDATAAPVPEVPDGWCRRHDVPMKQHTKDGRSWYSHQVDGEWCRGK